MDNIVSDKLKEFIYKAPQKLEFLISNQISEGIG
jgi:hypothetical protein